MRRITTAGLSAGIVAIAVCSTIAAALAGDPQTPDAKRLARLKQAILERFDANHNSRLDAKEQATATRVLLAKDDSSLDELREQLLEQFDKNGNGRLERSEIRAAFASINKKSRISRTSHSNSDRQLASDEKQTAKETTTESASGTKVVQQVMAVSGLDAASAEEFVLQRFDMDGDGVLSASELAAAQFALSQQIAQAQAAVSSGIAANTSTTGSTTGTTTGTGTSTSSTTGSTGMAGGCSGSSSGSSSSGSSGTGSTTSTAQNLGGQAANGQTASNAAALRSFGLGIRGFRGR